MMIKPEIHWRWTRYPVRNIRSLLDWCIDFVRRGLNGFAPSDTYCWDTYIAQVNIEALQYLKREQHGMPMFPDLPEDHWENHWNEIMDKMIAGFQAALELQECDWQTREELEAIEKTRDEGLHLYAEYFNALWD